MKLDLERVRHNVRQSSTEDLLDRLTVFGVGMEPEALRIIEEELRDRGISGAQIEAHAAARGPVVLTLADGTARSCSFCRRPAVAEGWGWHQLWGLVPVFPRYYFYCAAHQPRASTSLWGSGEEDADFRKEENSTSAGAAARRRALKGEDEKD
jgi:hypothetical protein